MSSRLQNRKSKLMEDSDRFEESLNEEFSEFSKKAGSYAAKALLIGGSAVIAYFIVKAIVGSDDRNDENAEVNEKVIVKSGPSPKSMFLRSLSDKAALVVLELARETVMNIIKNLPEKNDKKDS